ncbi:MAG: hypothetical protein N2578_05895, partial [Bdellovibrionaceae bacterium]|nr:hypothetical protein [Pseudobdellovibrionaceae bacterium]
PKPTGDFKSPFVLTFPKEPELAARVLYSELRRGAESGADHLIYRKEGHQQGEAWSAFLDRIVKASSLVIGSI